jgi:hypothetical protein
LECQGKKRVAYVKSLDYDIVPYLGAGAVAERAVQPKLGLQEAPGAVTDHQKEQVNDEADEYDFAALKYLHLFAAQLNIVEGPQECIHLEKDPN